jgi:hypothetical protein
MVFSKTFFAYVVAAMFYVSAFAQIPNAGFESWTTGNPDGWVTSNITGFTNVTQSTTAHSGSSALHGVVIAFPGPPPYNHLQPVIQSGPNARGFAYNQRPVSVTGYYQFFPVGGDRFAVNVGLFHGGIDSTNVGIAALAISSGASSYTQFNATFTYQTSDIPDTCIMQFQIVGPTGIDLHDGSYFLLDDLAFSFTSAVSEQGRVPVAFGLTQNYPNPFNPSTTIEYSVPHRSSVEIKVLDVLGREIATLLNEEKPAGAYTVRWDADGAASGVYFYKLRADGFVQTRTMLLVR